MCIDRRHLATWAIEKVDRRLKLILGLLLKECPYKNNPCPTIKRRHRIK
jgi:hypothetical protein